MQFIEFLAEIENLSGNEADEVRAALAAHGRVDPDDPATQMRIATWLASKRGLRGQQLQRTTREIIEQIIHDAERLEKLIGYYTDGWGGFPDDPDPFTEEAMNAIQHLRYKNPYQLTADELAMADTVLAFGSNVPDEDLDYY